MAKAKAQHTGRSISDHKRKAKIAMDQKLGTTDRTVHADKPAGRRTSTGGQITAL